MSVRRFGCYITPIILLGYAIKFATADATVNLDYIDNNLAKDVRGYGLSGKVNLFQSNKVTKVIL